MGYDGIGLLPHDKWQVSSFRRGSASSCAWAKWNKRLSQNLRGFGDKWTSPPVQGAHNLYRTNPYWHLSGLVEINQIYHIKSHDLLESTWPLQPEMTPKLSLHTFLELIKGIFRGAILRSSWHLADTARCMSIGGLRIGCVGGSRGSKGRCSKTWSLRNPSSSVLRLSLTRLRNCLT